MRGDDLEEIRVSQSLSRGHQRSPGGGVLEEDARRLRLIDAIVHAVQLGRDLEGEIHIFDVSGRIAEVLPLPASPALAD